MIPTALAPAGSLLALAPHYPRASHEQAQSIGWLVLATAVLVGIWAWSRSESWRRAVMGREDPRIYAMLRIAFSVVVLVMFVNKLPLADLLWSDEGMFTLEAAQRRWGASSLRGWSPEDGFFGEGGWPGFFHFMLNRPTLLVMHASPAFVHGYLAVFFASLVAFAVGFRTRIAAVVGWFMLVGLYNHNAVYLEGSDTVVRCIWWVLLFARTDAAWSVDAWIVKRTEQRRLRAPHRYDAWRAVDRSGHLAVAVVATWALLAWVGQPTWPAVVLAVGGIVGIAVWGAVELLLDQRRTTEAGPRPFVPLPMVPRFPRLLLMVQVSLLYLTTGLVKTGHVWAKGDALYFAVNNIHLARWEAGNAFISAWFGPNLFRVATWVTHAWEIAFPVILLGCMLRFEAQHAGDPWAVDERARRGRIWLGRAALVGAAIAGYAMARAAYPFMLSLGANDMVNDPGDELRALTLAWWIGLPLAVAAWHGLGWVRLVWPLPGPKGRRLVLDQSVLRKWLLGRRLWLGLGVIFHGLLIFTLNIGMFPQIMLVTYLAFFEAEELLAPVRRWIPSRSTDALVGRPPALGDERVAPRLPGPLVAVMLVLPVGLAVMRGFDGTWSPSGVRVLVGVWLLALVWGLIVSLPRPKLGAGRLGATDPRDAPAGVGSGPPLIASTPLRVMAGALTCFHALTIATLLLPTHPVFDDWRRPTQRVFIEYADAAHLRQGWKMFAPNPPRSTVYMQTLLVEEDGDVWWVGPDFFDPRPAVFMINDRRRKMHRRMIGKAKWYLTPWAEAHCREWVKKHGEAPKEVIIRRIDQRIPRPAVGWWGRGDTDVPRPHVREVRRVPCGEDGGVSETLAARWGIERPGGPRSAEDLEAEAKAAQQRAATLAKSKRGRWEAEHESAPAD